MESRDVLKIEGLRLTRGSRVVLRDVDLHARSGELVALMGLSGGGKTTILRCVAGLETFDAGVIKVDNVALRPGKNAVPRDLRKHVGMVFQLHYLFEHLSVIDNVTLAPLHVARIDRQQANRTALALLESLGVDHRRDALPRELSGGEAQRVAIARAMAMDPPLLLMDEPTASLDPARRGELGETLVRLTRGGRTLVVTTHDDDFVREFADRVIVLAEGSVVEEGAAREVLANPQHAATKTLLAHDV